MPNGPISFARSLGIPRNLVWYRLFTAILSLRFTNVTPWGRWPMVWLGAGLTASHDVISVSVSGLAEYLVRYAFLAGKVAHIPKGVDLHRFTPKNKQKERHR